MRQKEAYSPTSKKDLVAGSANSFLDALLVNMGFLDETEWKYIERSILSIIKAENEKKVIAETAKMVRDWVRNCFASWTKRGDKFKKEKIGSKRTIAIAAVRKAISDLFTWVDSLNDQDVNEVMSSLQGKINSVLAAVRDARVKKIRSKIEAERSTQETLSPIGDSDDTGSVAEFNHEKKPLPSHEETTTARARPVNSARARLARWAETRRKTRL